MMRLLIADDQALFANMLKTILETNEDMQVVACACNGDAALEEYLRCKPDVCLLDIQMPGSDGIGSLKRIKQADPQAKVIMLTTFSDDVNIIRAYVHGADGYLLKDILPQALVQAIQCVCAGICVMNRSISDFISQKLAEGPKTEPTENVEPELNERDLQIIRLIAQGLSNKSIADKLNYSEGTVRNRISSALAATNLSDRTQLVLFAIKNRLI